MNYYDSQQFFWEFIRDRSILSEWIRKWGWQQARPFPQVNIDILDLTAVFRTLGFTIDSIDNVLEAIGNPENRSTEIRLEFTCSRTGLRSTLTKQMGRCTCPTAAQLTASRRGGYSSMREVYEYVCIPEEVLVPYMPPSYIVLTGNLLKTIFTKFLITKKETPEPLESPENESFDSSMPMRSCDYIVDISTSPTSGSTPEGDSDSSEFTTGSEDDSFQSIDSNETSEEEYSDVSELSNNNYSSQGNTSVSPNLAQLFEEEAETRTNSSSKNDTLFLNAIHYKTMEIATSAISALLSTDPTNRVAPVVEYSNQAQTPSPTAPQKSVAVVKKCSPSRIPILRKSKFVSSSSLLITNSESKDVSVASIKNSSSGDGYQLF